MFLPPLCKCIPTSSIKASFLVKQQRGSRKQASGPGRFLSLNPVFTVRLNTTSANCPWALGWEARGDSLVNPYSLYVSSVHFSRPLFPFFCNKSQPSLLSLFPWLPLLSYHLTVVYYCMSFSSSAAVLNCMISLVLFYQDCHPLSPFSPPCPRSVSLTFYPHAVSIFLCPIRLSSSLAPVISHVPILSVSV